MSYHAINVCGQLFKSRLGLTQHSKQTFQELICKLEDIYHKSSLDRLKLSSLKF